jgi:excisionase family DNA binding protein
MIRDIQTERRWLIKKDAMRYLKISQRTIENWVNQGVIKSYQLGGRIFFDQNEIDQDIANSRLQFNKAKKR